MYMEHACDFYLIKDVLSPWNDLNLLLAVLQGILVEEMGRLVVLQGILVEEMGRLVAVVASPLEE